MGKSEVYRIPVFHCLLACLACFILGLGIGVGLPSLFGPKSPKTPTTLTTVTTPTPSVSVSPTLPEPTPSTDQIIVSLYFDNILFNPNAQDCTTVFLVKRAIPKTNVPVRASLDQLFLGPTETEMSFGYRSIFSEKTKNILKSVNVKDRIAYLDFDKAGLLEAVKAGANSSCGGAQFRNSIHKTLSAFVGIETVSSDNFTLNGSHASYINLMQQ